jgi:hypothetical protein
VVGTIRGPLQQIAYVIQFVPSGSDIQRRHQTPKDSDAIVCLLAYPNVPFSEDLNP